MTAQELPQPRCAVCGTTVALDTRRCPKCGLARPAARGHKVLARSGFVLIGFALVFAWIAALAVVAAAR
jgi:hypothetical protein